VGKREKQVETRKAHDELQEKRAARRLEVEAKTEGIIKAQVKAGRLAKDAPLDINGANRFAGAGAKRERFIATYKDGTVEEHWVVVPRNKKRCTGKINNGPYKGQRCRKQRLRGVKVCMAHGGSFATVRQAAQKRLAAAADYISSDLIKMASDKNVEDKDRLRAMIEILNRAGVDGKTTVTIEVKPWQDVLNQVASNVGKSNKRKEIGGK
jgi:hypothetical protein